MEENIHINKGYLKVDLNEKVTTKTLGERKI